MTPEVEAWRLEQLEELGLDPNTALERAADPLVDVATARELRRRGCDVNRALFIATRERETPPLRLRVGRRR